MAKKTTRKKTGKKTSTKRTVRRKKTTARRGRPPALTSTSTSALMAELARRERQLESLVAKRDACAAQLDELNAEIAALSGAARPTAKRGRPAGRKTAGRKKVATRRGTASRTAAGKPRKRPHNETTLEEAMAKVLKGVTMGVTEVADAVQKAGYKTSAANFRTIVNQTLIRSKAFKKVARGKYTAA